MLDNPLISLIRQTIIALEASAGISGTPIKQAFQPTQQGVNTQPTAYLYKIGDKRIGTPLRSDKWDSVNSVMTHTETQIYETTFQLSVLATQDPANTSQYTASDITNLTAHIMQSDAALAAFRAQDIGVLRVMEVRNPYFSDDRGRFEASPSFDFILTHKQVIVTTTPIIQATELQILNV